MKSKKIHTSKKHALVILRQQIAGTRPPTSPSIVAFRIFLHKGGDHDIASIKTVSTSTLLHNNQHEVDDFLSFKWIIVYAW